MKTKDFKILKNLCIEWYLQNISEDMHDKLCDVKKIYDHNFSYPILYLNITVGDEYRNGYFFIFCWTELTWHEQKFLKNDFTNHCFITNVKEFIEKVKKLFIEAGLKDKILEAETYKSSKELKNKCINYYNRCKKKKKENFLCDLKIITKRHLQILLYINDDHKMWGERGYRLYIFFAINSEEEKEIKELISDYKKLCHYNFCYVIIRNFNDFIDLCYYPLKIIK